MALQTERLLEYLNQHQHIDPLEAWTQLGIYRLSDVVFRLKKEGVVIKTERKRVQNKFDEECNVALYRLVGVQDE